MKKKFFILTPLCLFGGLFVTGCEKKEPPRPPINVTYVEVQQADVDEKGTWVGILDGYQNAEIRAQVTGYLLTQNYKEGSLVKKGEVLFTIDPRPFQAALAQAQAEYARAAAQAQLANITLQRQSELYKTKVISQQEYDNSYQSAQAEVASAAAAQASLESAQINLNYCTIIAPFDGIVGVAQAQIGDLVGPGGTSTVLTQMSQVNPIKVNFSITEQEYLQAAPLLQKLQSQENSPEDGKLQLTLADGSVYPEKGWFDFVNRQVNVATGTIQITGLFPNDQDVLRPGLFARVTAPVQRLNGALLVPQAAIVELQGNHFVSRLTPENTAEAVPIKMGPIEGQMQVIMGNIKAGDKVIVGGIEKARPGMKLNPSPYKPPTPAATPGSAAGKTETPASPSPTPDAAK